LQARENEATPEIIAVAAVYDRRWLVEGAY
jgi:hypothetical protein